MDDFNRQKIIYPEITKFLNFYLDEQSFFVNNKCFIITGEKLHFLCAFFNSSLFKLCYRDSFPELLGGSRELRKIFMDQIRVREIDDDINLEFKQYLSEIQKFDESTEEFEQLKRLIDQAIFRVYDLNDEDIAEIGFIEIQ
jgi:hypothetical protein